MSCRKCLRKLEIAKDRLGECAKSAIEAMQLAMAISERARLQKKQNQKKPKRQI